MNSLQYGRDPYQVGNVSIPNQLKTNAYIRGWDTAPNYRLKREKACSLRVGVKPRRIPTYWRCVPLGPTNTNTKTVSQPLD